MALILSNLNKRSLFKDTLDEKEHRKQIDHDLQRLFDALRPSKVVTLDSGATLDLDVNLAFHFRFTLNQDITVSNPTNGRDGQHMILELIQDSTGNREVTSWGSQFGFGSDLPEPTLSTSGGARDFIGFIFNSVTGKWYMVSCVRGY